jgi:lipopolysaccharide transport system ATP-binding protein
MYHLGKGRSHDTLRDQIVHGFRTLAGRFQGKSGGRQQKEEILWALKDVSFDVAQGEVVGILGANGAGKSTLLKLLSQVTEPTEGEIRIRGRIASLLEVGTGFHPELTGRENVYLNGSILGMSKAEIHSKFDEIVAFAGVERFLDTPVKRYSSGMYVRLAFAIAAHLEPEILVVDEVLAVGDAAFQRKCLGKMQEVGKSGRTVLFVSHNMATVESLCTRGIVLRNGEVYRDGPPEEVISAYLKSSYGGKKDLSLKERRDRKGSGLIRMTKFEITDNQNAPLPCLQSGKTSVFKIHYRKETDTPMRNAVVSIDLFDEAGVRVLMFRTNFSNSNLDLSEQEGVVICEVPDIPLANGSYRVGLFMSHGEAEVLDWIEDAASVPVNGGDFFGTGHPGMPTHCKVLARATWRTVPLHGA